MLHVYMEEGPRFNFVLESIWATTAAAAARAFNKFTTHSLTLSKSALHFPLTDLLTKLLLLLTATQPMINVQTEKDDG